MISSKSSLHLKLWVTSTTNIKPDKALNIMFVDRESNKYKSRVVDEEIESGPVCPVLLFEPHSYSRNPSER
eukprot:2129961-Heterocapsa_arctica.AAC.1